jgi:hypothetical protein
MSPPPVYACRGGVTLVSSFRLNLTHETSHCHNDPHGTVRIRAVQRLCSGAASLNGTLIPILRHGTWCRAVLQTTCHIVDASSQPAALALDGEALALLPKQ